MRFTDGNGMIRPEYNIDYAHEFYRVERQADTVSVIAATKHIRQRGDILGGPTLQIDLTTPLPNVIGVEISHFLGSVRKRPEYEIRNEATPFGFEDGSEEAVFTSGDVEAHISKTPDAWDISFRAGGKHLTRSAFKAMARVWNRETETSYMVESLELNVGAYVYGLGERFGPFVKNGQSVEMWNADGGTGSEQAYKNVPFLITNQGYGIFVANSSDVRFEIATERVERIQFSAEGERLKYYLVYGDSPKDILRNYTRLTGRPALPPPWTFGLWLTTSFITDYDEETVNHFLTGMADRDIPLSVFHFDCFWMRVLQWCDFQWDLHTFPEPKNMLKRYHDKGLKICVWINPYVGQRSPMFREGTENGYFLQKTNGDVWQTDKWQPGMAIVDFTNPGAVRWYLGYLENLLDMGVDCFKTDFGERIPVRNVVYHDGSDPLYMHNYYAFLYNKAVFELLERKRGKNEAVLFARSATAGGQQFPVHWGGDNSSTYLSMADTLRAGLSLALSGFGFWSHDISGFENTAPADLYKRWCAFGMLSSHSRLHGSSSYRVPWLFDEEASDVLRYFVKLKCRLMPYLYAKAVETHKDGIPIMRPMLLEFPEDPTCEFVDRQYMLGDALLVAPVLEKEGNVRFYLPAGKWISVLDDQSAEGGRWYDQQHSFMSLPLYARENSVVVMGSTENRPDYDYTQTPVVHVYQPSENAELTTPLYDGKGETTAVFHTTYHNGTVSVSCGEIDAFSVIIHFAGQPMHRVETANGKSQWSANSGNSLA